jgi:hypothetical protein
MSASSYQDSASRHLLAGVVRADITPPVGIAHANWGAQAHERAAGVDLPLWATALVLSDGNVTTVIVDLDIIGLRGESAEKTRQSNAACGNPQGGNALEGISTLCRCRGRSATLRR